MVILGLWVRPLDCAQFVETNRKAAKKKRRGSPISESENSAPEHTPLSTSELRRKMQDPRFKAEKGRQKQMDKAYGIDAAATKAKQQRAKEARKKAPKGKRKVQKTRTFKDAKGRTGKLSSMVGCSIYS